MNSLEAKVVILGAQGAGKTSLVVRFVENNFHRNQQSTIGASFLVKKVFVSFCFWTELTQVDRSMTALCGYRFVVFVFSMILTRADLGYGGPRAISIYGTSITLKSCV
jgi:hypothetical protein